MSRSPGRPSVSPGDRPAAARPHVIPEELGSGRLPRKDLKDAAGELTSNQAGLIVIGQPKIEKAFDQAVQGAAKVVKRSLNAMTDEIAGELQEALKS